MVSECWDELPLAESTVFFLHKKYSDGTGLRLRTENKKLFGNCPTGI